MNNEYFYIDVRVTSIRFPDHPLPTTGGFIIFNTDKGVCKGFAPYPIEIGMAFRLKVREVLWHEQRQFEFSSIAMNVPIDPRVLLDYCCDITKGLGPKTAEKIWCEHGEKWQEDLDLMKASIALPLKRTLAIFLADGQRAATITYATSLGFTPRIGELAYEKWSDKAVGIMKQSPYSLAQLPRVGFKTVDAKREAMGIPLDSEFRCEAAIFYTLDDYMEQSGNSLMSKDLLRSCLKMLNIPDGTITTVLKQLLDTNAIVEYGEFITTKNASKHEKAIFDYIKQSHFTKVTFPIFSDKLKLDDEQRHAVTKAVSNLGLTIINGGAGSGKTTIIKEIASNFEEMGEQYVLCSFAGKAAARIREATGYPARTIHSALGYMGDGKGFSCKSLSGVSIIVDEASMVPSWLLYEIVNRNPTRLILVGDHAQLQPVGIGAPFYDMIEDKGKRIVTLENCYRNSGAIHIAARQVRTGVMPSIGHATKNEYFLIDDRKSADEIHCEIMKRVNNGEIDFAQDVIIAPRNGDGEAAAHATVAAFNNAIQSVVNPHSNGEKFKVNDRVMCIKNNSQLDLWNGTTGWISRIDIDGSPYFKTDEGNEVKIPKQMYQFIVPAYCITVHKAQGSQYRNVYVALPERDVYTLVNRAMLYTAITRAKRQCVIYTDANLSDVIRKNQRRYTLLERLLAEEASKQRTTNN